MSARLTAALLAGRMATGLSRRLGRGGGTVIAGHVVPRIDPTALRTVTRRLRHGTVLVSGTNGKTTTSRLISHILRQGEIQALHNRAGANLVTGLVSAVVAQTSLDGWPRADVGLFEVDEATVPAALREIRPRAVLLTNIFRDQLDRYGEVHFVADLWAKAIRHLSPDTTLILNADDPLVATLGRGQLEGAIYFGVGDAGVGTGEVPHASDARICPACGTAFAYDVHFYGHLGRYACPGCGLARPVPSVEATSVTLRGDRGTEVTLRTPLGEIQATLSLPGLYNVYNALAATAVCLSLGLGPETIKLGLESFTAAFGRLERVKVGDRELFLALVKNPVGFGEVLRTILTETCERTLVIAINDNFADGTDISWLWDVDFERLEGNVSSAICSGTRAEDMAVRLKYALVPEDRIVVEPDPRRALAAALERAAPGETVYVLPTYTAMLELREVLRQDGHVAGFWQD
ncbi:MAG TPA: Mur ligase family protein [Chloroflexota bacterium]|nr:Mur ligase family protein [Chloroflexota bacterium]